MNSTTPAIQKRNRSQLSCTACRQLKSKCDREQPCSQCLKKGRGDMCEYPLPARRKKPAVTMQKRLRHLESMVKDIMPTLEGQSIPSTERSNSSSGTPQSTFTPSQVSALNSQSDSISAQETGQTSVSTSQTSGRLFLEGSESRYVGTSHWAAILENVGLIVTLHRTLFTTSRLEKSKATSMRSKRRNPSTRTMTILPPQHLPLI